MQLTSNINLIIPDVVEEEEEEEKEEEKYLDNLDQCVSTFLKWFGSIDFCPVGHGPHDM